MIAVKGANNLPVRGVSSLCEQVITPVPIGNEDEGRKNFFYHANLKSIWAILDCKILIFQTVFVLKKQYGSGPKLGVKQVGI